MTALMRWITGLAAFLLVGIACLLPRRVAHWLGRRGGGLSYFLLPYERRRARRNIRARLGLSGTKLRRVAMDSFRMAGCTFVELARSPCMTRRAAERTIEVPEKSRRILDAIRTDPRGALFAGAHYGNWELLSLILAYFTRPVTVVVRSQPGIVGSLLDRARARTGNTIIHQRGFVRNGLRTLRSGGLVGILLDHRVGESAGGRYVDFLGTPSRTSLAGPYIAAKAGVPIYVPILEPLSGARYRILVHGPYVAPKGSDPKDASLELATRISATLTSQILKHPEHWGWWLRRWKHPRPAIEELRAKAPALPTSATAE